MATPYCENDPCETEAVRVVPVSLGETEVEFKKLCYTCGEAYDTGAQHGTFRTIRQLRKIAKEMEMVDECSAEAIRQAIGKLSCGADPGEEGLEEPDLEDVPDVYDWPDGLMDTLLSDYGISISMLVQADDPVAMVVSAGMGKATLMAKLAEADEEDED